MVSGLVSVVIPTHFRGDILGRAIDSVLSQTYKNIEINVVSDGKDEVTDILMKEYIEQYENIHYESYSPSQGGNHARNIGIKMSKGEFVAFLDDDDKWLPNKIEKQIQAMKDPTVGLVCTAIVSLYDDSTSKDVFIPSAPYNASKEILLKNCIGSTTTVMVRSKILEQSGLFDEELGALQDYDLWIRICQIARTAVIKDPCVEYNNSTNNNQISQYTDKYEKAIMHIQNKYEKLFASLSDDLQKKQKINYMLILARKAIRNKAPKQARNYVKSAMKYGKNKEVFVTWCASFFSPNFLNKTLEILQRFRKKCK